MINKTEGSADAGIFSFADDVGSVMMVISMSFNKSWTPIFYQKMNENDVTGIRQQTVRIIKYTILAAIFLIFFSREMILLMANQKYISALSIVPIIILGKAFGPLYTIYSHITDYYKKMIAISITTILVGFFNIFLNSVYIPHYGLIAGAYTALVCSFLLFVFHYITARFILGSKVLLLQPLVRPYVWVILAVIGFSVGLKYIESAFLFFILRVLFFLFVAQILFKIKK